MSESSFIPETYKNLPEGGDFHWQAPSNIALVKYWGKHGEQLPQNSSISFTLSKCFTETKLQFERKISSNFQFEVFLDGKREQSFEPKIHQFFKRIETYLPFLKDYTFAIHTANSFPHSSGIASSASGMSALSLCLMSLEKAIFQDDVEDSLFNRKASFLARLGSGSACRSTGGQLMVWGEHPAVQNSSDLFGVEYPHSVHKNFSNYRDCILLVDKGEKQVSSSVGHNLMHNHPYAKKRFETANSNIGRMVKILADGDLPAFIEVVESEALQLHAMMMTSLPYFILMKPNSLEIINRIWQFRKDTGSAVCFTLDAGANVHVLYPEAEEETTFNFIESELLQFCRNREYIADHLGAGPIQL